jgi:hypothetical protein
METEDSQTPAVSEEPAGTGEHVVRAGECISSIAYRHGHFWQTILNHPDNLRLRNARKNHNVLLPGDRLTIPPISPKEQTIATEKRHTFRRKGIPEVFRLRLLDEDDEPRANLPYVLVIDGAIFEGSTGDEGELKHSIPPDAREGRLILGKGDETEEIELRLGELNPADSISGVQARLTNLGFDCGPVDGILGPKTRKALARFQKRAELEPAGEPDATTLAKLKEAHGS